MPPGDPPKTVATQFLRFALVGAVGFLVDASTLSLYLWLVGGLYSGRVVAWFVAVSVNWALNRRFTFKRNGDSPPGRLGQWGRFVLVNSGGGVLNLVVYTLLVSQIPLCAAYPILAQAAGTVAGLLLNFTGARRLVFAVD